MPLTYQQNQMIGTAMDERNKMIDTAMDERNRKFAEYEKYVTDFDDFLQKNDLFKLLNTKTEVLDKIVNGGGWDKVRYGIPLLFSNLGIILNAVLSYGLFREGPLAKIANHANEPEMQKLLVEKTCLLDKIGENKDLIKRLVKDFALTGDDENTKLLRDTTNATLDMLGDKDSREALQNELVNNYFKFSINSFNPKFIDDYVQYEQSQVKKIDDLQPILARKNQRELNIVLQNLKNSVANIDPKDKPNILRTQLSEELQKLGMKENDINVLLAKNENLKLSDAQYILQQKYTEVLQQQYSDLKTEVGENPSVESIREKADLFLRKEAQYKLDTEERAYLNSYVENYVRFEQGKQDNAKTQEELTREATTAYLNQAPDYMRLTENVLNMVAQQEMGKSDNLRGVLREQGKDLIDYFKGTKRENKMMQGMLNNFGIGDGLLDVVPAMLAKPDEIVDIIHAIRSKPLFQWAEDLMDKMIANKELRQTFQDNPQLASNVAIGMVNSLPFLKNMCDDFGCSKEVLAIIAELVKVPEEAKQILNDMNRGDYNSLVKNTLKLIEEKESLQTYLKENGQAYATLVSALFKQLEPMKNMKENYGLNDQDIEALVGIIPHLLNDPAKLNAFYDKMSKEKYLDMVIEINDWAKDNKVLQDYLKDNAQGIGVAIEKAITHSPADAYIKSYLSEINLDIQGLVSATLQHSHLLGSDNLHGLLNGIKSGDLPTMLASIDKIIDDPNIKEVLSKAVGGKSTELILKLSKITNKNQMLKDAVKQYSKDKDYYKLIGTFLGNEDFKTLLVQEKENIANFAEFLVEKVPMLRDLKNQYLGAEIKVDELIQGVISPGVIEGIESYLKSDRGKIATVRLGWALSGIIVKFPILNYLIPTPTQGADLTTTVKSKIDTHSNEIKKLSEVLKAGDNSPELKQAIEQKSLAGITLENAGFEKIHIDGFNFANAKFFRATFREIENASFANATFDEIALFERAKISNTNFAGATFNKEKGSLNMLSFKNSTLENVNFDGINVHFSAKDDKLDFSEATIDAYTLESLAKAVNKNPDLKAKLDFEGAKIKGGLSQKDLSNLPLKDADLSAVTSMNGTILSGTNLENARIDKTLFRETIGLDHAKTSFVDQELKEVMDTQKESRQAVIANKIASTIVAKLLYDGKLVIAEDKAYSGYVNELAKKFKTDIKALEPGMVNHIYDLLETNYAKLENFDFENVKHYTDLASSTQGIPKLLLDSSYVSNELTNEDLGKILKYEMMKNLIADAVGSKLFGEGNNRGKDFMLIREHLSKCFSQLSLEEKESLYENLIKKTESSIQLKYPDCEELIDTLKDKYYAQTKYTKMGIATSGIYLPENALDKLIANDLIDLKGIFNEEQQEINNLAKQLGQKGAEELFGVDMSATRQADAKKITKLFKDTILPEVVNGLSEQEKNKLFATDVSTLIGNHSMSYWRGKQQHSISQILYDNTSYTKAGYASGGIQVNDTKLHSATCKDAIIGCIKNQLGIFQDRIIH